MSRSGVRKLLGYAFILLVIVLLFGYYKLGGFNPVQAELVQVNNYYLAGRNFQGSYKSDTVRVYFNEMRDYVQEGKVKGQPVIIYDQEPTGKRGHSAMFIGVRLTAQEPPGPDLEIRPVAATRAIRISKDAHISVMPNPDKIGRKILRYAEENGLEMVGSSIEIYFPNNRLVIEQPVKED